MLNSYNDTDPRKAELVLQLLATKEFITCDNIIKSMCHGDRTYANVEEVTRRLCGISSEAWVSELSQKKMLVSEILQKEYIPDINTINTWAEPHNANGVTPNTIIDSNDEPPANNQQRMVARNY